MMLMSQRLNRRYAELRRLKVRRNSAGMDGVVSFSLQIPSLLRYISIPD